MKNSDLCYHQSVIIYQLVASLWYMIQQRICSQRQTPLCRKCVWERYTCIIQGSSGSSQKFPPVIKKSPKYSEKTIYTFFMWEFPPKRTEKLQTVQQWADRYIKSGGQPRTNVLISWLYSRAPSCSRYHFRWFCCQLFKTVR